MMAKNITHTPQFRKNIGGEKERLLKNLDISLKKRKILPYEIEQIKNRVGNLFDMSSHGVEVLNNFTGFEILCVEEKHLVKVKYGLRFIGDTLLYPFEIKEEGMIRSFEREEIESRETLDSLIQYSYKIGSKEISKIESTLKEIAQQI